MPLVKASATFRAPARVGDLLTLSTRISRFGSRSFDLEHRFFLDDTLIVEGAQTRVWGHAAPGRPDALTAVVVPDEVRVALSESRVVHLCIREQPAN